MSLDTVWLLFALVECGLSISIVVGLIRKIRRVDQKFEAREAERRLGCKDQKPWKEDPR